MRRLALITAAVAALLLAQERTPKPKYDPDALPSAEIACGRLTKRERESRCHCMRHRLEARKAEEQRCLASGGSREAVLECVAAIRLCELPVVDAEQATRENMPEQCKRSCSLAKCRCCHS